LPACERGPNYLPPPKVPPRAASPVGAKTSGPPVLGWGRTLVSVVLPRRRNARFRKRSVSTVVPLGSRHNAPNICSTRPPAPLFFSRRRPPPLALPGAGRPGRHLCLALAGPNTLPAPTEASTRAKVVKMKVCEGFLVVPPHWELLRRFTPPPLDHRRGLVLRTRHFAVRRPASSETLGQLIG